MVALNQSQLTDRHGHVGFFAISVRNFFPIGCAAPITSASLSILFLSLSFAVNFVVLCQLLLEYSTRNVPRMLRYIAAALQRSTSCHMLLFRFAAPSGLFSG